MKNYRKEASEDAQEMARNFLDEIVEQIVYSYEASDDLFNDYPNGDAYHHESHVDRAYNLQEAAELLDELSPSEETDSGLWEGQSPRDAISTQAAFTYGNAVMEYWQDLIKEVNSVGQDVVDDKKWEQMEGKGVDEDEIEAAKIAAVKISVEETIDGF